MRGHFLGDKADMLPTYRVKVHKCASLVLAKNVTHFWGAGATQLLIADVMTLNTDVYEDFSLDAVPIQMHGNNKCCGRVLMEVCVCERT